jgi:hypothetical protein
MQQEDLKAALHYDKATGVFRWRHSQRRNSIKPWSVAGALTKRQGYIEIWINKKIYKAHRLAWLYVHGSIPSEHIDHVNGDKADNRIENLREANNTTNHWNEVIRATNLSGHKGVWWHKQSGKWEAACRIGGKQKTVGRFERIEDAVEAVKKFREQHHGQYTNHG